MARAEGAHQARLCTRWIAAHRRSLGTVAPVQSGKITCRESSIHGRGVFALVPCLKGQVLDRGPVLLLPHDELDGTLLGWYVFAHDDEHLALCLGHLSMTNHSMDPNAEVFISDDGSNYELTALRDILPNEEIFIDYGPDYGL